MNVTLINPTASASQSVAQFPNRYFTQYHPQLAAFLENTDQALLIQQIHYWLQNEKVGYVLRDGRRWIYNGYSDWIEQLFPWKSISSISRMVTDLENRGWVITKRFYQCKREIGFVDRPPTAFHEDNQRKWYCLDYDQILADTGFDLLSQPYKGHKTLKRSPRANLQKCKLLLANLQNASCISANSSYINNQTTNHTLSNEQTEQVISSPLHSPVPATPSVGDAPSAAVYEDLSQTLANSLSVDSQTERSSVEINSSAPACNKNLQSPQRQKFVWELAVGEPYPAFLNWRYQTHYKPQGGRWETGGSKFAYSEFYKDPGATTATLYRDFLDYIHRATENANQLAAAGMDVILPSVLADRKPAPTEENTQQLMHNVQHLVEEHDAKVALPQSVPTPSCRQAISWAEATNSHAAPLPTLTPASAPILPAAEADSEEDKEQLKLVQKVERQRTSWKNIRHPMFRAIIRKWAEETPGVVMTEDGPQLESVVSHPTQEVSAEAPAREISAEEAINSINNHATPLEEPSINPYLGNPDPADFTPPPDPWGDSAEVGSQLGSACVGNLIDDEAEDSGLLDDS